MCRPRRNRYPKTLNSRDGTGRDGTGRRRPVRRTRARCDYMKRTITNEGTIENVASEPTSPASPNRTRIETRVRAVHRPLIDSLHALAHSYKQYSRLRNDSLNTNGSRRTLAGPIPGPPPPPRAHVAKHLLAHFSIAPPFGPDVSRRRLGRALALADSLARRPSGTSSM